MENYLIDANNNNLDQMVVVKQEQHVTSSSRQVALISGASNSSTGSSSSSSLKHEEQQRPTTTTTATANNTNIATSNGNQLQQPLPKPRGRRKKIRAEPIRPICPQCEKQFSNQSALTKHKLTHSDERKFACHQCSKAFKRHDHLTGHMQTHSNRKPFNCTIQGCDKTYCDARSLRRHKENIHHIVTPKDNNNNHQNQHQQKHNSSGGYLTPNPVHQSHAQHLNTPHSAPYTMSNTVTNTNNQIINRTSQQQQQQTALVSSPSFVTQPSQLLCRRIQRLNSDPGESIEDDPVRLIEMSNSRRSAESTTYTTSNQATQSHHHQQAFSYSADYASTQQFTFEPNHLSQLPSSSNSIPRSANSITDSGLELNSHYEQPQQPQPHTPMNPSNQQHHHHHHSHTAQSHQQVVNNSGYMTPNQMHHQQTQPLGPPHSASYTANDASGYTQQQTILVPPPSFTAQPSQLLCRRIQRLNSDPGGPANGEDPERLTEMSNRRSAESTSYISEQTAPTQQHQTFSYSGEYTPAQQFSSPSAAINTQNQNTGYGMDQQTVLVSSPSFTTQPSQLSSRRIQRLNSDPGEQSVEDDPVRLIEMSNSRRSVESTTYTTNSQATQSHHHQQAFSYSADYASTQQFTFEPNHLSQLPSSSNSIPHSANSITDSGLELNSHYEQPQQPQPHTPMNPSNQQHHHNHAPQSHQQVVSNGGYMTPNQVHHSQAQQLAPPHSAPYTATDANDYTQQQTVLVPPPSFTAQPSQLLCRRIQRLNSDPGGPANGEDPERLTEMSNRRSAESTSYTCSQVPQSHLHHNNHQQQAFSYSADYASTQQFTFSNHETW